MRTIKEVQQHKDNNGMIGYTTLGTNDLEKATEFYDALFKDLGLKKITPNDRLVLWSSKAGAAMLGIIKPFDG